MGHRSALSGPELPENRDLDEDNKHQDVSNKSEQRKQKQTDPWIRGLQHGVHDPWSVGGGLRSEDCFD